MSFFKRFPFIQDYEIQGKLYTGMDLSRRTRMNRGLFENRDAYVEYSIKNGETPEMIADRFYDDASLYWIILEFNLIADEASEWPLSDRSFERFVTRKYDSVSAIHHYESLATGNWVSDDHPQYDLKPVTNYEYELDINEKKRSIRLLIPRLVGQVVAEHNRLVQE